MAAKDLFARERELCLLFIKNNKKNDISFDYSISNKSVDIIVLSDSEKGWDVEEGRRNLNRLWKNFYLAFIGYKTDCVILQYRDSHWRYVTEYFFPMIYFNLENFHSKDFEKYNNEY